MRKLTGFEEGRLAELTASNAEVALLEITETGLKKSIMDATRPLRRLLLRAEIHDFNAQGQGASNKFVAKAIVHGSLTPLITKASLYRPETKKGDPRIWFYGLKDRAKPGDILAIIPVNAGVKMRHWPE